MNRLEDFMPEMASVLEAQESALENVVSSLVTQVHELVKDNSRLNKHAEEMEANYGALRLAFTELQAKRDTSTVVTNQQVPEMNIDMEATMARYLQENMKAVLDQQLADMETRVTLRMDEQVLETSNRSFKQAQQTADDMKNQVALLEKKFEFLSRVKMEIKEVIRRIERQEELCSDLKIGMEMLAKNIATDDTESDGDESNLDEQYDFEYDGIEGWKKHELFEKIKLFDPSLKESLEHIEREEGNKSLLEIIRAKNKRQRSFAHSQRKRELEIEEAQKYSLTARKEGEPAPTNKSPYKQENKRRQAPEAVELKKDDELQSNPSLCPDAILPVINNEEGDHTDFIEATSDLTARTVSTPTAGNEDFQILQTSEPALPQSERKPLDVVPRTMRDRMVRNENDNVKEVQTYKDIEEVQTYRDTEEESSVLVDTAAVGKSNDTKDDIESQTSNATSAAVSLQGTARSGRSSPTSAMMSLEDAPPAIGCVQATPVEQMAVTNQADAGTVAYSGELDEPLTATQSMQLDNIVEEPTVLLTEQLNGEQTSEVIAGTAGTESGHPLLPHLILQMARAPSRRSVQDSDIAKEEHRPNASSTNDPQQHMSRPRSASSTAAISYRSDSSIASFASSSVVSRSRRRSRFQRRSSYREQDIPAQHTGRASIVVRLPMTREQIKALWQRTFKRLIQLNRLEMLTITGVDRSYLPKQSVSVGSRMRRFESIMVDLEDAIDVIDSKVQNITQTIGVHDQLLQTSLSTRLTLVEESQQKNLEKITEVAKDFDALEQEVKRQYAASKRESMQSGMNLSTAVASVTTQCVDLKLRLEQLAADHESTNESVRQLIESDINSLTEQIEATNKKLKDEMEKTSSMASEWNRSLERIDSSQKASYAKLEAETEGYVSRLYSDILMMSVAPINAVEIVKNDQKKAVVLGDTKRKTLIDVSARLLHSAVNQFCEFGQEKMQKAQWEEGNEVELTGNLLEKLSRFHAEIGKVQEQYMTTKSSSLHLLAKTNTDGGTGTASKSLEEKMVVLMTAQIRHLDSLLSTWATLDFNDTNEHALYDLKSHVQDLVIQLRAVLWLMYLCSEMQESNQHRVSLQTNQEEIKEVIVGYDASIAQFESVGTVVKLVNARVDSLLELSLCFAKEDDMKASLQALMDASEDVRTQLQEQVEVVNSDAAIRDEKIEEEIKQLVGRLSKKSDKDELLWTQDVLERQLYSIAKASLGENHLRSLQRALKKKVNKDQLEVMLTEQRLEIAKSGLGSATLSDSPSVGTKCISCSGELPPTKAMIKSLVKAQVHQELSKLQSLRNQSPNAPTSSPPPGFNVSNFRSLETHKKELLRAASQQPRSTKN